MSIYHDPDWIILQIIFPKRFEDGMDNAFLSLNGSELTFGCSYRWLEQKRIRKSFVVFYNAIFRADGVQLDGLIADDVSDETLDEIIAYIRFCTKARLRELKIVYVQIKGMDAFQRLETAISADRRLNGKVDLQRMP